MIRRFSRSRQGAFTLAEMLVSIAVLTLLIVFVNQLVNSASKIATIGNKHMDSDNQARPVLDRMAEDIGGMVKRSDIDYLLKQPNNPQTGSGNTSKNDQIAFYTQVEGYAPTTTQSHLSLVAYRIYFPSPTPSPCPNCNKLERLAKGLIWNGQASPPPTVPPTPTVVPMVFLPIPLASPLASPLPSPMPIPSPAPAWPQAGNMLIDPDYELFGPQIFRFEYYYQLLTGDFTDTPWDTDQGHNGISGLRDVATIVVVIATIDPKSRLLLTEAQLATLAGQMPDHVPYKSPGNSGKVDTTLSFKWQTTVNSSTFPKAALTGIHFYQRTFYLTGLQQ